MDRQILDALRPVNLEGSYHQGMQNKNVFYHKYKKKHPTVEDWRTFGELKLNEPGRPQRLGTGTKNPCKEARRAKLYSDLLQAYKEGTFDSPGLGYTTTSQTDPPSAKVAPVVCQLATMAVKIKTVAIRKKWVLHGRSCHPVWDVSASASGLSCTRLADFLPPW